MLSILSRTFCLSLVNLGQWRKNWLNVSISKPQIEIGLSVSKTLCLNQGVCLNLCSLKWLRTRRRRVRQVNASAWLTLKLSSLRGRIKFKIFFLKIQYEGDLRIFESKLFNKWGWRSFDYFLFGMNCFSKNLSQINILGTVL